MTTGAIADQEAQCWCHQVPLPTSVGNSGARKEPSVFVELNTRHDSRHVVSLEWDRDTGKTQIVVADSGSSSMLAFPVAAGTPATRSAIPSGTRRERHPSRTSRRDPSNQTRRRTVRARVQGPAVTVRRYAALGFADWSSCSRTARDSGSPPATTQLRRPVERAAL